MISKTRAGMTISRLAALAVIAALPTACARHAGPVVAASELAATPDVYHLGLGDKLRVNVFGEPSLSGEYQVSGNGAVTMPLIGDVKAVGLTARELEAALTTRYAAGYLKQPRIAVEVFDFRPYSILGEVQRPGRYQTSEGLTVLGAVAAAGGYTYRANTHQVFLRRAGETAEHQVTLDRDFPIQPGDIVRVGERYF
ncbi:polysaccharide export outer membrane protein [Sphingomonas gellani]|uniref:Polysaccharide export outer membrane protein n=1 Tax=Sphingomonas gellani TaxID=1166340 RepID=A0A1H8HW61_9SPHN|nr:polysaccharide biosynthesis/export family protein [Sphingomonas gellani]SEN59938.1 polysaccharide export outer membrane protein [Sphingomonas gellani]